jgi:signal transduction histidine kinase/CheY-like chemotaxis protein
MNWDLLWIHHRAEDDDPRKRKWMAWSLIAVFVFGPTVFLITLVLLPPPENIRALMWAIDITAFAFAGLWILLRDRMNRFILDIACLVAIALISIGVYYFNDRASPYALFYFWPLIQAAYFLTYLEIIFQMILVDTVYGIILSELPGSGSPALRWGMMASTLALTCGLVLLLKEALTRQSQEIETARKSAEESTRMKSAFLANMSHEIRTPLNGVLGMAEMLMGTKLTHDQREQVDVIHSSGQGLLNILNDILDLSKIEAGKIELQHASFDLIETVRNACILFGDQARRNNVPLVTNVSDHVRRPVIGDANRLRQVLVNLIGNSVKFTDKGSITVQCICRRVSGGYAEINIAVTDSGIGIRKEDQAKLFDTFTQADNASNRSHGGTGLGLAISKELIQLMGGTIELDSVEAQGTIVTINLTLPIASDHTDTSAEAALLEELKAADEQLRILENKKILIVDDNEVNLRVSELFVRSIGAVPFGVSNGQAAIDAVSNEHFDAILMDCQMPDLDGYETTRRLRVQELENGTRRTPIIALTASALQTDIDRCAEAGMDAHLAKPINQDGLRAALAQQLVDQTAV